MIMIELTTPQTVNGRRAAYQSLWLLIRVYWAWQSGQPKVRLDDLKGLLSDARSLRMAISRAFRDFGEWGIKVGWGEDIQRDPRFLNTDRRSQGPFWLTGTEAAKLAIHVDQHLASAEDITAYLGLPQPYPAQTSPINQTVTDLAFWQQIILARQASRLGRLASPVQGEGEMTALTALKTAHQLAIDSAQEAHVLLAQAGVWRRLGDGRQARRLLRQLREQRRNKQVAGHDFLDAMEQILAAWCAYDQRDFGLATTLLAQLHGSPNLTGLLRYHPQIRFEWHNLSALVLRTRALAFPTDLAATDWARQSLQHFETSLMAAFESNSMDAAQQGAANLGMACWLLHCAKLIDGPDPTPQAVQRIAFSEWLCQQSGLSHHSAWNPLYLMRIARGHCNTSSRPSFSDFQCYAPWPPTALRDWARPFADALPQQGGWHDIAASYLQEHDSGRRRYPVSQVCALLFERAWYSAHAAQPHVAHAALQRLQGLLPELSRADREYYRGMWSQLPAEIAPIPG
ncbi:hypothetical protein [Chitinivorax sp. B]|uniref:hypothetical protein n=1 Tax=Chitinivorax sp. B TaxID=2502235 RepID=UPI0010F9036B|nr:hypothetical protein [Chitinivorax sp. B]